MVEPDLLPVFPPIAVAPFLSYGYDKGDHEWSYPSRGHRIYIFHRIRRNNSFSGRSKLSYFELKPCSTTESKLKNKC